MSSLKVDGRSRGGIRSGLKGRTVALIANNTEAAEVGVALLKQTSPVGAKRVPGGPPLRGFARPARVALHQRELGCLRVLL